MADTQALLALFKTRQVYIALLAALLPLHKLLVCSIVAQSFSSTFLLAST
jgi:hypothetical protein